MKEFLLIAGAVATGMLVVGLITTRSKAPRPTPKPSPAQTCPPKSIALPGFGCVKIPFLDGVADGVGENGF